MEIQEDLENGIPKDNYIYILINLKVVKLTLMKQQNYHKFQNKMKKNVKTLNQKDNLLEPLQKLLLLQLLI